MLKEKLKVAIDAAIAAGDEIMKIYTDFNRDFEVEHKSDNSPLTIADKKSHNKIMDYLNQFNTPILSEEGVIVNYSSRKWWNDLWIIDPLDGTKEFIKRSDDFTVNIAYVSNEEPVMGVIYIPVTDTLYFGEKGLGAFKLENAKSYASKSLTNIITASRKLPLKSSIKPFVIVASVSHMSPETEEYLDKIKKRHPNVDVISRGSSIKICLVAEGSANVYPRFAPTMEWDTAAGDAIARAAGKMIFLTDEKTPLKYNKEELLNPFFIVK